MMPKPQPHRRLPRRERDPTIALINIVFLMLIFFLVAGTIGAPVDSSLSLVRTADIEGTPPADALLIRADGTMSVNGAATPSPAAFVAALPPEARARVRIVPDRDLPAQQMVAIGRALRAAGAGAVMIVTERAIP